MDKQTQAPHGTCGDLKWTCRDGVLYVRGEGTLKKEWVENLPDGGLRKYSSKELMEEYDITSVVIAEGCSGIGKEVFRWCNSLVAVEIPAGVKYVGEEAFQGCSGLTEVKIPKGATIGRAAFASCDALEKVVLPEDMAEIDEYVFSGCTQLRCVKIPEGITKISFMAFAACESLTAIELPDSLQEFSGFSGCTALNSIYIPAGVTCIGNSAFTGCTGLKSITIPQNVRSIQGDAFKGCTALENLVIPETVTEIGRSAFTGVPCVIYRTADGSDTLIPGQTQVKYPFGTCGDLTWTCRDGVLYVQGEGKLGKSWVDLLGGEKQYGSRELMQAHNIIEIVIAEGCTEIDKEAFMHCDGFVSVEIPCTVKCVGSRAFWGCSSLVEMKLPKGAVIADEAFLCCTALERVELPENLTVIRPSVFYGCKKLRTVRIPEGVVKIGARAFQNCVSLSSVALPNSLLEIRGLAFEGCTALETLVVPVSVKEIGTSAFKGVPNVIRQSSAVRVETPKTQEEIPAKKVTDAPEVQKSAAKQVWDSEIFYYVDDSGVLHITGSGLMPNFDTCEYACYSPWMHRTEYDWSKVIVHEGVESLGEYAFWRCDALTEIVLPESLTYIGKHCFEGCKNLRTFRWPARVSEIKSSTFKDCEALETVELPDGIQQLWRWSFQNCGNLKSINIPKSVTRISTTAFYGANLQALRFASERFWVKDGCLYARPATLVCASFHLEELTVPEGIVKIADYAFYKHTKLRRVILPATVTVVEKRAFYGCTELEEIVCQGKPPRFGEEAVCKCGKLQS